MKINNQETILNFKKKFNRVAQLIIYAKILVGKRDFMGASLIACKAHDLLALSEKEIYALRETDCEFEKLYMKCKGSRDVPARKRIFFVLEHYYLKNISFENLDIIKEIVDGIPHEKDGVKCRKSISDLRNNIIHVHTDFTSPAFKSETDELVDRLFALPFVKEQLNKKYTTNLSCNYEVERDLIRQIGIISHEEEKPTISNSFVFSNAVFENLLLARKSVFPLLKKILKERLNTPHLDCSNIQISNVDSTSAYIWLSIPIKTPTLPAKLTVRPKMYLPSLSVLMTPLEFMIYIDFAGFSYAYRVDYYKYLLCRDHLHSLISSMKETDSSQRFPNFACLRNVHWYTFQNNIIYLNDISLEHFEEFNDIFIKNLRRWIKEKRDNFHECIKKTKPITWNICLAGWKYPYTLLTENRMNINELVDIINENANGLEPLMDYITSIKKPFKKSNTFICKRFDALIS